MSKPIPPPPPPPPGRSSTGIALAAIGGVIVALLLVVVVVQLNGGGTEPGSAVTQTTVPATVGATVSTDATVPTTTGSTAPVEGTTLPLGSLDPLQTDDLLIANAAGVGVYRAGGLEQQPDLDPTQMAMSDGFEGILIVRPDPGDYPDFWPSLGVGGADQLWRLNSDGSSELVYQGSGMLALFDVAFVTPVSDYASSAVMVDTVFFDDFPFSEASIVVVPLFDDNPPKVIGNVAGGGSFISGLTWYDEKLLASVSVEGNDYIMALDVDGNEVALPGNPAPSTRTFDTYITNLTRVGDTNLVAYIESADPLFLGDSELVLYALDSTGSEPAGRVPLFGPGYAPVFAHANSDRIVVSSSLLDDGSAGGWPYSYDAVYVYDFRTDDLSVIPPVMGGIATVVP